MPPWNHERRESLDKALADADAAGASHMRLRADSLRDLLTEMDRIQGQVFALSKGRDRLMNLVPVGEQVLDVETSVEQYIARLRRQIDSLRENLDMSCESPPEDCQCPGCSLARDTLGEGEPDTLLPEEL